MTSNIKDKCLSKIAYIPEYFEGSNLGERNEFAKKFIYSPSFNNSINFRVSTGAFRSTFFSLYKSDIAKFAASGGKIKLITEDTLDEDDKLKILEGYDTRANIIEQNIIAQIQSVQEITKDIPGNQSPQEFLSWLISENCLDIKIGIAKNNAGIHHTKYQIWTDKDAHSIYITGSRNVTTYAQLYNQEERGIRLYLVILMFPRGLF